MSNIKLSPLYSNGESVVIIDDTCSHRLKIGSYVVIEDAEDQRVSQNGIERYVTVKDIAKIESPKTLYSSPVFHKGYDATEVKTGDIVVGVGSITYQAPSSPKPDGGPAQYYDFPKGATTLNDLIEHKEMDFHRGNIFKACWRYGTKTGVTKDYDARKIIYSGCRILKVLIGGDKLQKYLQQLIDDPQFK